MPKGWQSGKTAQYDDEFEEEAAPKFDYSPKDSKAYWDAVEAFAQDIKEEAQETGQDVNELVHSWVDGSEYSFKPRMEKIVLAESPNADGSAFEAMVADIMQEMGKSASKRGQMDSDGPMLSDTDKLFETLLNTLGAERFIEELNLFLHPTVSQEVYEEIFNKFDLGEDEEF